MIEVIPINEASVYGFRVSGRLTKTDYQEFLPVLDELIQEKGKISLLVEFRDFKGWDLDAAEEDYRFGMANQDNFDRIAIVGDKAWQRWMTALSSPFVSSEIRYFDQEQKDQAWEWLNVSPEETAEIPPPATYRHILIATDFSQAAQYATLRGIDIARQYDARISLIHVVEDTAIMMDYQDYMPVNIELEQILIETTTKQMSDLVKQLGLTAASTEIGFGTPSYEIPEYAKAHDVDLIVIATRGRRGLGRLLGSTARSVQQHASCDVLLVRFAPGQ
jgi:universal stress protein A